MAHWIRYSDNGKVGFGTLEGNKITAYDGDIFDTPQPNAMVLDLNSVELLTPCQPKQFLALWNNFYSRAEKEGWNIPPEPLFFTKIASSFHPHSKDITRPNDFKGPIYFEGELGIVIGKTCQEIDIEQAGDYIFGYTCVNDVTAGEVLWRDDSFPQWTRAKGYNTFGVFGPSIATNVDVDKLVIQSVYEGEVKQNYPVTDMVYQPHKLVATLSQYMTLMPGDIIACGTALGAGPMEDGETIEIVIDGVGILRNTMKG